MCRRYVATGLHGKGPGQHGHRLRARGSYLGNHDKESEETKGAPRGDQAYAKTLGARESYLGSKKEARNRIENMYSQKASRDENT